MFLGLAVRHFSLFGSTEEPVARLTKESRLRGQELHTCGKGNKHPVLKRQSPNLADSANYRSEHINESTLTNRVVRVEGRERVVVDCRRCCICFLLRTLVITLWFVHLFLSCGKQELFNSTASIQPWTNGWVTEEKASSLNYGGVVKTKPRLYLTAQEVWRLHWCPSPAPVCPAPPCCADRLLPRLVRLLFQGRSCWRCVHSLQEAPRQPAEPQQRIQLSVHFLNRCQGPNYFIFPSPKPIDSKQLYLSEGEDPVAQWPVQSHVATPVQVVLVHTLTHGRQTPQVQRPPLLIPPKNHTSRYSRQGGVV